MLIKKLRIGKTLLFFYKKLVSVQRHSSRLSYIFLGLTIFGINKTPKTKISNGAIITKNDSIVI